MTRDATASEEKSSRSYWGFVLCLILAFPSFGFVAGCTTPRDVVKDYAVEFHPPKAVADDVGKFIAAKGIQRSNISEVRYGVDAKGRRAVRITQEIPGSHFKTTLAYVLYYDKDGVRTSVRKLNGRRVGPAPA
jgi:hypothetical protein